ncbi:hypothetical protein [Candidatus Korarchaeum cryptofilum]|nr:hypothetical protein [Candidatus Korarchaeum cryptofilum]
MMNRKAFLVIAVLLVLITVLIALITIKRSPEQSGGRDAIFIDRKDLKKSLDVPQYAILKIKDKIYALGGYDEGVAVILSEDLRPICHAKLKHELWRAEKYDEDRFVAMSIWYWYSETLAAAGSNITMFDYKFNQIWSVNGNFTDFRVANNKIYVIEHRGNSSYLDIFDGNGNLIKSFKVLDEREVEEELKNYVSIEAKNSKIYVAYISGGDSEPHKLMLLRFDEQGNLELKKAVYGESGTLGSIRNYRDGLLLPLSTSSCRFIYVDRDGNFLGEARWKPPFGEGCAADAKVFNGRAYILGYDPNLFAGYVGLINESIYVNGSFYYTKVQEIFVKRDSTWQSNSVVRDVLLNDELYVIGLVQMHPPSGAFIARVDPYLNEDISYLLERADVVYLEDIPPCKS